MAPRHYKSRIHLLAARTAPTIAIIQRKRSKLFHLILVDTKSLGVTQGSWFRGKLYPLRCDLSFDGRFMVYLAMGSSGKTWNGICRPPWLTTVVDAENIGTWFGGGYFASPGTLRTNGWVPGDAASQQAGVPFKVEAFSSRYGGEDLGVIYERFERDGFTRAGLNWGAQRQLASRTYSIACDGDDGWSRRPSRKHPMLCVRFVGYLAHGYTFAFLLDEYPHLLEGAQWATWDASANLWVAWPGLVSRFTLEDLRKGTPSFSIDVEGFEPVSGSATPTSP